MRPLKDNDQKLLAAYDRLFEANRMLIAEITPEVVASATALRARYGFKTPDAIHLASAIEELSSFSREIVLSPDALRSQSKFLKTGNGGSATTSNVANSL